MVHQPSAIPHPHPGVPLAHAGGVPGDSNPLPIDPRPIDRRDTDDSLREERTATDELLGVPGEEPPAVIMVRERRNAAAPEP